MDVAKKVHVEIGLVDGISIDELSKIVEDFKLIDSHQPLSPEITERHFNYTSISSCKYYQIEDVIRKKGKIEETFTTKYDLNCNKI